MLAIYALARSFILVDRCLERIVHPAEKAIHEKSESQSAAQKTWELKSRQKTKQEVTIAWKAEEKHRKKFDVAAIVGYGITAVRLVSLLCRFRSQTVYRHAVVRFSYGRVVTFSPFLGPCGMRDF